MTKYWQIFITFLRLGCTSFGGPMAHIAYFKHEFVDKKHWLSEKDFASILSLCQTLPGPASSQLGFAIGLLKGGYMGAITAFIAFTFPTVLLLIVFAQYLSWFQTDIGLVIIQALSIVALVVVLQACFGMAKQLCNTKLTAAIATISFVVLLNVSMPFSHLFVIVGGGLIALLFASNQNKKNDSNLSLMTSNGDRLGSVFYLLFFALLITIPFIDSYFYEYASEFYQTGALVFGGGHVVLPLLEETMLASSSVSESEFFAGYGATQAMPGPMFAFAAYLGFVSADSHPIVSAIVATFVIFLPGFLLITAAMHHWQLLNRYAWVQAVLVGANASVVGLLAATLYDPIFIHAVDSNADLAIAGAAFVLLTRFKVPILALVAFIVVAKLLLYSVF